MRDGERHLLTALALVAFALLALGSMPPPSARTSKATSVTEPEASKCSTDFDCGFGNQCVKPPAQFTGECMRAVDKYGTPTYKAPAADYGPGKRECQWFTDCPIGFQCTNAHCVK